MTKLGLVLWLALAGCGKDANPPVPEPPPTPARRAQQKAVADYDAAAAKVTPLAQELARLAETARKARDGGDPGYADLQKTIDALQLKLDAARADVEKLFPAADAARVCMQNPLSKGCE